MSGYHHEYVVIKYGSPDNLQEKDKNHSNLSGEMSLDWSNSNKVQVRFDVDIEINRGLTELIKSTYSNGKNLK